MPLLPRLASLWRNIRHKKQVDQELTQEVQSHLELLTELKITQGLTSEEARRAALIELGGVDQVKERVREVKIGRTLETVWQDLRNGTRMMIKQPVFSLIAILTLALGIGANTAILSAVNGFILRPLPVDKPDELVAPLWGSKKDAEVWGGLSYHNYVDLRDRNQSLSGLLAWRMTSAGVSSGASGDSAHAEVAWGELVSANYFDVLGVKPVLGRGFLPEEERTQDTHPVVVISHSLWQERFNADLGVVGKKIYLNGTPFTVVGVAPATFKGLKFAFRQAFWAPLMMSAKLGAGGEWETDRSWPRFDTLGRLKPGITKAQAEADLNRLAEGLAQQYPKSNADTKVQVVSQIDGLLGPVAKVFRWSGLVALCGSGLVLLLACANIANLLLARATSRAKEIGIRQALGAGRTRIVRQLLTESALLALLGGALGWLFAYGGAALFQAATPPIPFPIELNFNPDLYVLKWMAGVTLATVVFFGLVPALKATTTDLVAVIKTAAAGQEHRTLRWRWLSLRKALVVVQVAISILVLICAGLFLRTLNHAAKMDPGFRTENLITMKLDPELVAYDETAGKRFYTETLRRVTALPGVRTASLASFLPLGDSNDEFGPVLKEGEPEPLPNQGINVWCNRVGPGYFATVKTPLVRGRDFTEHDTKDAPLVVIVNQEFARRFYGREENALGKRFRFWTSVAPLREIVGIAKDGLYHSFYEDPHPYMFLPEYQLYQSSMMLLVSAQSVGDLRVITEKVRHEITQVDARMPISGVAWSEANMSFAYWGPRLSAGLSTALGLLALLLATMGVYSVMTYTISQRTREMGIRMALGAQMRDVLRLIIRQGMRPVLIGIVLGLACAWGLTRLLASFLLGVGTTDPFTFAGMAILLVAVASVACYLPARRATKADPVVALRLQ